MLRWYALSWWDWKIINTIMLNYYIYKKEWNDAASKTMINKTRLSLFSY